MKYVITGATGRTSRIVAERLLDAGKKINVISRNKKRLKAFEERGAHIFEADPSDLHALVSAFKGAEAAWIMLQPNYIPDSPDFRGFQSGLINALVEATLQSGLKYAVTLSSWGAHVDAGNGPVAGLHDLEQAFDNINGLNVLHLRVGYFMENMLGYIPSIIRSDKVSGPFDPTLPLPFIATKDIGIYAADALINLNFQGKMIRELHGERDLTISDAVKIIGNAIGRPDLPYIQLSNEDFKKDLIASGVSENVAGLMDEVVNGINSKHIKTLLPRTADTTTPTSFERFIKDVFLPEYNRQLSRVNDL